MDTAGSARTLGRVVLAIGFALALSIALPTPRAEAQVGGIIEGMAFLDSNMNGVRDATETGVGNLEFSVYNSTDFSFLTTVSAADGTYAFTDIPVGDYTIGLTLESWFTITVQNAGFDDVDSDFNSIGRSHVITIGTGEIVRNVDAGIIVATITPVTGPPTGAVMALGLLAIGFAARRKQTRLPTST